MSQNNTEFQINKDWSEVFSLEILRYLEAFLYPYKFEKGTLEEDRHQCCDFKAVGYELIIASRMRDYKFYQKFSNDITISTKPSLDGKSELYKIMEGYGDYYFYGFATLDNLNILSWKIYDLNIFRSWAFKSAREGTLPSENTDFHFIPFNTSLIPKIIVAYGGKNEHNTLRLPAIRGIV